MRLPISFDVLPGVSHCEWSYGEIKMSENGYPSAHDCTPRRPSSSTPELNVSVMDFRGVWYADGRRSAQEEDLAVLVQTGKKII